LIGFMGYELIVSFLHSKNIVRQYWQTPVRPGN